MSYYEILNAAKSCNLNEKVSLIEDLLSDIYSLNDETKSIIEAENRLSNALASDYVSSKMVFEKLYHRIND